MAVLSFLMLPIVGAFGQSELDAKLDDIDRSFVCPENQPNDQARRDAVKQFLEQMTALQPNPTIGQVMGFRAALLRKHNCTKTLANMEAGAQSSEENPNIAERSSKDRWEQIEKTSGGNPITVSVDVDRVVVGPEYTRIWIRYLNDQPDQKKAKQQLVHEKIDCLKKSHLAVSLYAYDATGQVLFGGSDESGELDPVIQGSLLADVLPFFCSHR